MKLESRNDQERLASDRDEPIVLLQNPKTDRRAKPPEAVVLHYTAVRALARPPQRLEAFRGVLGPEYGAAMEFVRKRGEIPSALMLSLANASNAARRASWDFTVGKDGLIVQCNLSLSTRFTWHAGRALGGYLQRFGSRDLYDYRKALVYDGESRRFVGPRLPKSGTIMQSGNAPTLGIELDCWGRVSRRGDLIGRQLGQAFKPIPGLTPDDVIEVDGKLYERVPPVQYEALVTLCRALRDFYDIPENGWFGHRQIVPDRRTDPDPPLDLERLMTDIYADRVEIVAVTDDDDFEDAFIGAPLDDNDVG